MKITPVQYHHKGDPKKILEVALNNLGLSFDYLEESIDAPNENWESPSAVAWFNACELLYLDCGSIQYGYAQQLHKGRISYALKTELYRHPKTKAARKILKEIRQDSWREFKWALEHYGFRLKCRHIRNTAWRITSLRLKAIWSWSPLPTIVRKMGALLKGLPIPALLPSRASHRANKASSEALPATPSR